MGAEQHDAAALVPADRDGSAAVLLAATLAALVGANADPSGYVATWGTDLSARFGSAGLSADAIAFPHPMLLIHDLEDLK